jgi:hypothetical protein
MSTYAKSSEISAAIAARIAGIRTAQGSETDIGSRVYRGRRNVDENAVPCAVVIEGADAITDRPGKLPTAAISQRYVIAAYVKCDPDNPNDAAHAAIRDIKRSMFAGDGDFGGRVIKVSYRGRDIGPRADGVPIVFATVEIDVDYVEDLTNP